jgi:hypothetical protein
MARAHSRGAGPLRSSLALRVGGTALVIVTAAAVTSVLLLAHSGVQARKDTGAKLSRKVTSALTVGLYNPGPAAPRQQRPLRQMLDSQSGLLTFTAALDPGTQRSLERWTADKMSDDSYIYIFVPSGKCLTASAHNLATVFLANCDLGVTQRWRRVQQGFLNTGLYYWELRSQLNGRCLTNSGSGLQNNNAAQHAAQLEPCGKGRPASQLIRMHIAY